MRLIRWLIAAAFCALAMIAPQTAIAGPADEVVAEAEEEGDETDPEPTGPTWVCEWYEVHMRGNQRQEDGDVTIFHIDAQRWKADKGTGEFFVWARETCTSSEGDTRTDYRWRLLSDPDPTIVIDPAYDKVVKKVDPPTPSLSPVGPGYVNLGMWLAIEEQPPVVARAEATPTVWAEVTATLDTTTFGMGTTDELGNPAVVACDGAGVPIPDSAKDSIDEGPDCGFTYRDTDGSGEVTITATWVVTYELSDGRTGSRDPIVLTTTVPYEVLEIQTVGVDG